MTVRLRSRRSTVRTYGNTINTWTVHLSKSPGTLSLHHTCYPYRYYPVKRPSIHHKWLQSSPTLPHLPTGTLRDWGYHCHPWSTTLVSVSLEVYRVHSPPIVGTTPRWWSLPPRWELPVSDPTTHRLCVRKVCDQGRPEWGTRSTSSGVGQTLVERFHLVWNEFRTRVWGRHEWRTVADDGGSGVDEDSPSHFKQSLIITFTTEQLRRI